MRVPEYSLRLISLFQKRGHKLKSHNIGLVKSSTVHLDNGIPKVRRIMKWGK